MVHCAQLALPLFFYPELKFNFATPNIVYALLRFKPDIVHFVDPILYGPQLLWICQWLLPNTPRISSFHTNLGLYASMYGLGCASSTIWSVKRSLHDLCKVILCPSASTRDSLQQQGFRKEKIRVRSRGVDCSTFAPIKLDEKLRSSWLESSRRNSSESFDEGISMKLSTSDLVVLLYVGRLAWEKNLRVLIEAYRGLDHAACHLVIVGDGPARTSLEEAFCGLPVTFTGYCAGEDLARYYASADLFVFPSVSETFEQVVTEAHASGLPVVAINSEGVKDILLPWLTGILVDRNDEDQERTYRQAIERLVLDSGLRQRMSKRARERAADFTWDGAMENCINAYREVLAASSSN